MTLKPMMPEHFKSLEKILTARVAESHLEDVTIDKLWFFLEQLYAMRSGGVYVDDLADPKHCLVMMHYIDPYTINTVAFVVLIYSDPCCRGKKENVIEMIDVAESYAKLVGALTLDVSSWVYRESKGTDALWLAHGFEPKERKFTKTIK